MAESVLKPTLLDTADDDTIYPDSDGQPMSDNTLQFQWIVTIKENLELLFAHREDVFVAGDLLWYPVQYHPEIRMAPDALVVFGRPKGYRGSYKQWCEAGIAPQVVFEVLSPGNRLSEMNRKQQFYDQYGVQEYYLYDPDRNDLTGWRRGTVRLEKIEEINNWISPLLGIRFDIESAKELQIYRPDGKRFMTPVEWGQQVEQEQARAEQERQRAEQERQRAEQERQRAERFAMRLKALGIDPDAPDA